MILLACVAPCPPARSYEYIANVHDAGVTSFSIPGDQPLLRAPLTVQLAAAALRETRTMAIDRCCPSRQLRRQLRAVLTAGGLRQLARVSVTFDAAPDVRDVLAFLTLLAGWCGGLQDLSLIRVGTEEPRYQPDDGGSAVAAHLGRRASRTVRTVRTGQAAAAEMDAMVRRLSDMAVALPPVCVLRLVDGLTVHPVHGSTVSAFERRAVRPLPALPAALHGSLRALSLANVRGDARLFALGSLPELRLLERLDVAGMEDVPLELPPSLRYLTVGAVTPAGLMRVVAARNVSTLVIRSAGIYPPRACPTDPDPLVILDEWNFVGFGVTCHSLAAARARGLLPRRLCFWKVGGKGGRVLRRRTGHPVLCCRQTRGRGGSARACNGGSAALAGIGEGVHMHPSGVQPWLEKFL